MITILAAIPCRYTIAEDQLVIRSGVLRYKINLQDIVSVEKSSSIVSGPALSMKRLAIRTEARTYLISPRQREEFIDRLKEVCRFADVA